MELLIISKAATIRQKDLTSYRNEKRTGRGKRGGRQQYKGAAGVFGLGRRQKVEKHSLLDVYFKSLYGQLKY